MLSDLRYWLRVALGGVFAALADALEEEDDEVYEEQLLTVLTETQAVALVASHGYTLEVDDSTVRVLGWVEEDCDFAVASIDYGKGISRQQAIGWAVDALIYILESGKEPEEYS